MEALHACVVGSCHCCGETLAAWLQTLPDVGSVRQVAAGLDPPKLPEVSGSDMYVVGSACRDSDGVVDLCRRIRAVDESAPIIVCGSGGQPLLTEMLRVGVMGFILKCSGSGLAGVVRAVARGERCFDLGALVDDAVRVANKPSADPTLTPRQTQVLEGVIRGLSNKEIANHLGIAYDTVKCHVRVLLDRYGVRSRHQIRSIVERDRRCGEFPQEGPDQPKSKPGLQ